jgi:hypothetical protein
VSSSEYAFEHHLDICSAAASSSSSGTNEWSGYDTVTPKNEWSGTTPPPTTPTTPTNTDMCDYVVSDSSCQGGTTPTVPKIELPKYVWLLLKQCKTSPTLADESCVELTKEGYLPHEDPQDLLLVVTALLAIPVCMEVCEPLLIGGMDFVFGVAGTVVTDCVAEDCITDTEPEAQGASDVVQGVPQASQPGRLQNIINNLFAHFGQPGTTGDGTTMAAVRNEILTGMPTAGKFHLVKAWESVLGLNSIISDSATNSADRALAEQLRDDLLNALGGK